MLFALIVMSPSRFVLGRLSVQAVGLESADLLCFEKHSYRTAWKWQKYSVSEEQPGLNEQHCGALKLCSPQGLLSLEESFRYIVYKTQGTII